MIYAFLAVVAVVEAYYWGVYFPRAWRDGSNEEINDLRAYFELRRRK